jgi:hypothetical protein
MMTIWNLDLAARQQLETLRIEAGLLGQSVAPLRIIDRDNAAPLYKQAYEAMGPRDGWPKEFVDFADPRPPRKPQDWKLNEPLSPQLRQVVRGWRSVVSLLHQAVSRPSYYVDRDYYRPTFTMPVDDREQIHTMAALLALDGREKEAGGDIHGAIQDIYTRLAMARHAATEPLTVALLCSAGLERNALTSLEGLLERERVSAANLAALQIENGPSYRELLQRTFRMDEAMVLMTMYGVDSGRISLDRTLYEISNGGQTPLIEHPTADSVFASVHRMFLLSGELDVLRRVYHQATDAVEKPYPEAKSLWERCQTQAKFDGGIFTDTCFPIGSNLIQAATNADAARQVARLGVAAYLFREKNVRFPKELKELVPDFIPSLPEDPFGGKPMKLKRTDRGIVIYSVGPDMTDDGGTAFDREKQSGDIIFEVRNRKP